MRNRICPVHALGAAAAAVVLFAGDQRAAANSGTQLPLNQYQAGTEQTSAAVVTNGNFELPGAPNPNPDPTGWTRQGTMQVGTPINPPTPPTAVGNFAAQGPLGSSTDPNKFTQNITLTPSTSYVLSGYLWNLGQGAVGSEFGDLVVVELIDPKNLLNTKTLAIERTASDLGDAANGYFVYDTFNSSQFPNGAILEVEADFGENVPGPRPNIWAQIDNVAITPAAQFMPPQPIGGGSSTWNTNGGGVWSNPANWSGGVPNAIGAVANFGTVITAPATITLDGGRTVGTVNFSGSQKYTIAGASVLTFDVASGSAGIVYGDFGSQEIATPVQLQDNTRVSVLLSGSTLRLSNQVSAAAGVTLTKAGAGVLEMRNVRTTGLTVSGGTVKVLADGTANGRSTVNTLAVDTPSARLDITNNAFVVDHSGTSPLQEIRDDIVFAYNNGAWDAPGITSSLANNTTHGVGYAEASSLATVPAFFGTVDSSAVLIRLTRYGDANLDGIVNLQDFNRLAANFGTGNEWLEGDFNYDGQVTLQDFNRLAGQFGQTAAGTVVTPQDWANLAAAVPEPSSMMMLVVSSAALLARKRRFMI